MLIYQLILAFQAGVLFNFALQSLGRSTLVNRRIDIHFWLGLTLLTATLYTFCQLALSYELAESTILVFHRLKLVSLLITTSGWVFTVYSVFFPTSKYPIFFTVATGVVLLFTPFQIFLSSPVTQLSTRFLGVTFVYHYGTTGPAYNLMVFVILVLFSLIPVIHFILAKEKKAGPRIAGALCFSPGIIGGLNDFAVTSGFLNGIMISEYVFFIFLAVISIYTASEDAKTVKRLANMNNELEERIRERTKELEASNQKLKAMATTDMLTGLCNRHQFVHILSREEDRITRYHGKKGDTFSLLFLDLDNFKYYNDNFGHAAGDLVLRLFADLLQKSLRASDTAARYGGDEFLILLPNTDETGALTLATRILERVEEAEGYIKELSTLLQKDCTIPDNQKLGCSIGLTSYTAGAGRCGDKLLIAADQALYTAKSAGKNCVKTWNVSNLTNLEQPRITEPL